MNKTRYLAKIVVRADLAVVPETSKLGLPAHAAWDQMYDCGMNLVKYKDTTVISLFN